MYFTLLFFFFYYYKYIIIVIQFFFFFKQKTAYEMLRSLVGSEMCIRDRYQRRVRGDSFSQNGLLLKQAVRGGTGAHDQTEHRCGERRDGWQAEAGTKRGGDGAAGGAGGEFQTREQLGLQTWCRR
eukprot:TRINITY_DN23930_c0_g1_i2.p1 TRINITY_DN23930_c0_g1~~TRINITY_DN23930_c0_g1_i2.p1  ORF type:complete len:126 (+),score=38.57 TRINITY_DN23930_c0_g1_i2:2-379(+)